jgi:hypothetical protein
MLMGKDVKRKLELRNKPNGELFKLYDAEIVLKNRNLEARKEYKRILGHFEDYLGGYPPSTELAKHYLHSLLLNLQHCVNMLRY